MKGSTPQILFLSPYSPLFLKSFHFLLQEKDIEFLIAGILLSPVLRREWGVVSEEESHKREREGKKKKQTENLKVDE